MVYPVGGPDGNTPEPGKPWEGAEYRWAAEPSASQDVEVEPSPSGTAPW